MHTYRHADLAIVECLVTYRTVFGHCSLNVNIDIIVDMHITWFRAAGICTGTHDVDDPSREALKLFLGMLYITLYIQKIFSTSICG